MGLKLFPQDTDAVHLPRGLGLDSQRRGEKQQGHCGEPGTREPHHQPSAVGDLRQPKSNACLIIVVLHIAN